MTLQFGRGRYPKDTKNVSKMILVALSKGSKTWSDLKNDEKIWDEVRSKEILSRVLKELIWKGLIVQTVKTHKNRPYNITKKGLDILRSLDYVSEEVDHLININFEDDEATNSLRVMNTILEITERLNSLDEDSKQYVEAHFEESIMVLFSEMAKKKLVTHRQL
jgi:DNA-binding HxlR family transcriptional regulator